MSKILVISPTPTHPHSAGNRARIYALLTELQKGGHQVYFLYLERAGEICFHEAMGQQWDGFRKIPYQKPAKPILKRLYDFLSGTLGSKKVLPYKIDDWFDRGILSPVRNFAACVEPDVVIVEYVFISKVLDVFDGRVLKILDTHDVFSGRDQLFIQNDLRPQWFYTTEEEEAKGVNRADIILAIQSQESAHFKRLSDKRVLTIGHLASLAEADAPEPALPPRLLFVGSSNHVNLDGIKWFLENVFPDLRKKSPEIELDIVGGVADFIELGPGLNLLGVVEELTPIYENASVVINPLQFGTGLKIKTIEALAMKRPLVTTPIGAAGIEEWAERAFICAKTPEGFAAAILRIINSKEVKKALEVGAEEFALMYNQKAFSPLKQEIDFFLGGKLSAPVVGKPNRKLPR